MFAMSNSGSPSRAEFSRRAFANIRLRRLQGALQLLIFRATIVCRAFGEAIALSFPTRSRLRDEAGAKFFKKAGSLGY